MVHSADEKLAELVGSIYAAGTASARWPDVLRAAASHFHAQVGMLWTHDFSNNSIYLPNAELSCMVGLDDAGVSAFMSHYYATNVWVPRSAHLEEGATVLSSQLYPESDLPHTEFYADWLRPNDLHHAIGSSVIKAASRQVKLSFVRPRRAGSFRDAERRRLAFLLPHVKNAFLVHKQFGQLRALSDSLSAALDRLVVGVVLVGANARVMHMNAEARRLIARTHAITVEAGEVSCSATGRTLELRRLIADAVSTAGGHLLGAGGGGIKLRGPGADLHVLVSPLDPSSEAGLDNAAAAMFLFAAREVPAEIQKVWRELHEFTAAEADVAWYFFQGLSPNEIALRRGSSVNTVRSQIRNIYLKTAGRRQVDVIRRLAESVLILRDDGNG